MKKAIVTGANGFVGTALVKELSSNGVKVFAVVKDVNENIDSIKLLEGVSIVYCELSQILSLSEKIDDRDIEVFYHLAWVGSAGDLRNNYEVQLNNAKFTCNAVHACKSLGCKRFVFAGSIMEYEASEFVKTLNLPPKGMIYSTAKIAAHFMAKTVAADIGVEFIEVVISNIYGVGEKSPRLINTSIRKLLNDIDVDCTLGTQMYDFIYIDDAAKAFIAIGKDGISFKSYYLGSLTPKSLREYLDDMYACFNTKAKMKYGSIPFNGVSLDYSNIDIEAVKNDTGFISKTSFIEGIKMTAKWIKEIE